MSICYWARRIAPAAYSLWKKTCLPEGSAQQYSRPWPEAGLEGVVVHRIGMPDSFIEHGTAVDQRRRLHLDADGIAQEILDAFFPEAASQQEMAPREVAAPA